METREDLVHYDFQGWPHFKMNLKEILLALGGVVEDNKVSFKLDDPMMAVYPEIWIDDAMLYPIDGSYFVPVGPDREEKRISVFRERIPSEERLAALRERWDEEEKMIEEIKRKAKAADEKE